MTTILTTNPGSQRPALIKYGLILSVLAMALGLINAYFSFPATMEQLRASGLSEDELPGIGMMWGGVLVGVVLSAVLLAFVWRGANPARWIVGALAIYGFVTGVSHVTDVPSPGIVVMVLTVVVHLMNVAAAALLFMPASNVWFKAVAAYKAQLKAAASASAA